MDNYNGLLLLLNLKIYNDVFCIDFFDYRDLEGF